MSTQGAVDGEARHESLVTELYQDTRVAEDDDHNRRIWSWRRLLHDRQAGVLNQTIRKHGIQTALELAPGSARLTARVKGLRRGVAVEASAEMLGVARRRLQAHGLQDRWDLREGNAFDLSSVDEAFPLVYSFRFIRHFQPKERKRLYREILARLQPSGLLVFDVANRPVTERRRARDNAQAGTSAEENGSEEGEKLPVYDALYTPEEFHKEMVAVGFDVVSMRPVLRHFALQAMISYTGDTWIRPLSNLVVRTLELLPGGAPLEWVAVVRKRS